VKTSPATSLIYRIILLATSLLALSAFILTGCAPAPATGPGPSNPASTPADNPVGGVAAAPLTVLSIVGGNVQVLKSGANDWSNGIEGMTLEVNDRVRTDPGGNALITFFEGSTVELQGDTVVSLSELGINPDESTTVRIKQEIGKTVSRGKKLMDTRDRYEIETPAAVAAVRGTTMYVEVRADGSAWVGNIEGKVVVIAQGKAVELPAGTHTTVLPGQAPGAPEPGATPQPGSTPTAATSPEPNPTTTVSPISTGTPAPSISTLPPPTATPTSTATTPTPTEITPTPTPPPVTVAPLIVTITSLEQDATVGRDVVVSGIVSDPSITEATLALNGVPRQIAVNNGSFSTKVSLADGPNTIIVSVSQNGVTASDGVELVPEP